MTRTTRRIPELDGIRGIAILLIIVVHFGDYTPTSQSTWVQAVRAVIGFGWTGVDLFFVLSGCLITGILLDLKGAPRYFLPFYARRALRILPLYYLSVALFFFAVLPLAHALGRGARIHESEQVWYWLYLCNWRIAVDEYAVEPLSHFWSLAIEEQFYLVWPLVVWVVAESRLIWICSAIIAGALALRCLPLSQSLHATYSGFLYALTPYRMDALAMGAAIAVIMRNPRLRSRAERWLLPALLGALIGLGTVIFEARSVRPFSFAMGTFGYTFTGLVFACGVLYALLRQGSDAPLPRLFRTLFLRSLGKYSYAMYVIHWPISLYLTEWFQSRVHGADGLAAASLCILAGLMISYGLALLSWHLFESRFLNLRTRFPYRPTSIQPVS